jgi:ABC-2 type transport system permease protein
MVIATPSFILSGFTWPLSQMPVWVQAISMWFLTHFLKAFRVWLLRTERFPKLPVLFGHGYWTICGILSYIALYFKRKNVLKEV